MAELVQGVSGFGVPGKNGAWRPIFHVQPGAASGKGKNKTFRHSGDEVDCSVWFSRWQFANYTGRKIARPANRRTTTKPDNVKSKREING